MVAIANLEIVSQRKPKPFADQNNHETKHRQTRNQDSDTNL